MKCVDWAIRLEWAAIAVAATAAYAMTSGSWALFGLLVLAPDLSMLGYLAGPRIGAVCYNAFHILVWSVLLILAGLYTGSQHAMEIALIWLVHISVDRALGYGLKLPGSFQDTHLGRIGRRINP
jgi:Domain of unknown function (DUF4260)